MKAILICLLLGLSVSYKGDLAVAYAKKHCSKYNPAYNNYRKIDMTAESINFMSQCIHAGGQNFTGCEGLDDKGMFKNIQDLKKCLQAKGWTKTEIFAPGNPIFQRRYAYGMIATAVEDKAVKFCSHSPDRCHSQIVKKIVETYAPPK